MSARRAILGLAALLWATSAANAEAPVKSSVPLARPGPATADARPERALLIRNHPGVQVSLRPVARPAAPAVRPGLAKRAQAVSPAKPTTVSARGRRGAICGSRTIEGQKVASIKGRLKGCGVSDPVRVSAVQGVRLSQPAIMDCTTAKSLDTWVKNGVKPAVKRMGGGVVGLQVAAHYSCRTRNSKPGAKISEHGRGRAIDISAINLKNGTSLNVARDWNRPKQGKVLKRIHGAACGPFGTVLGPQADRHHQDHFHLDTARYRGGAYCR